MTAIPILEMRSRLLPSKEHAERLFGAGHRMQVAAPRPGRQGQYQYHESVRAVGPTSKQLHIPLHGPFWETTVLELTPADAQLLGVEAPERAPGDVRHSATILLQGPFGVLELVEGVITPTASLYVSPTEAEAWGIAQGEAVRMCLAKDPSQGIDNVHVRVHPTYQALLEVPPGLLPVSPDGGTFAQLVTRST